MDYRTILNLCVIRNFIGLKQLIECYTVICIHFINKDETYTLYAYGVPFNPTITRRFKQCTPIHNIQPQQTALSQHPGIGRFVVADRLIFLLFRIKFFFDLTIYLDSVDTG